MKVPRKVVVLMHGVPLYWWFNAWWFATDVMAAMLVVYDKRIFNHRNCWHQATLCAESQEIDCKPRIRYWNIPAARVEFIISDCLHCINSRWRIETKNQHFRFNISLTCACLHPLRIGLIYRCLPCFFMEILIDVDTVTKQLYIVLVNDCIICYFLLWNFIIPSIVSPLSR